MGHFTTSHLQSVLTRDISIWMITNLCFDYSHFAPNYKITIMIISPCNLINTITVFEKVILHLFFLCKRGCMLGACCTSHLICYDLYWSKT